MNKDDRRVLGRWAPYAVISALCIYVFVFWAWASSRYPTQAQVCEPTQPGQDCSSYNIIFAVAWHAVHELDRYGVLITAIATVAIGAFTFTLKRSTDRLWDAGERHSERELRAYVLVSGAQVVNVLDRHNRAVRLTIRNFGQTPAHDVKLWMGTGVKGYPLNSALVPPPENLPIANSVLPPPPGNPNEIVVDVPVTTPWEEAELQAGRAAIYAHGQITYVDAFNVERETNFRHMCRGDGLPEGKITPCEDGNKYT